MTCDMSPRLARRVALLLPLLAGTLAAAPALAQEPAPARVANNQYVVVNQTDAPLTCRYRVGSAATGGGGSWQAASPIAAGAAFTRTARDPGESFSFDCNAGDPRGKAVTVEPGRRYGATRNSDGKVVVTRVRS
ncbi:MAG TPA: hypothetical protein VI168_18540 [Croceibacterium sp.]